MYNIYEVLFIIEYKSKLVGVWALDKLVHTNRYCEITYNIDNLC